MPKFIQVGDRIINLDHVTDVTLGQQGDVMVYQALVYGDNEQVRLHFFGKEAEALRRYFEEKEEVYKVS